MNELIKKKKQLLDKKKQIGIEKINIEFQLNIAKSKIKLKQWVDFEWMAKATRAKRLKSYEEREIIDEINLLNNLIKAENIKISNNEDQIFIRELFNVIEERFGALELENIVIAVKARINIKALK